MEQYGNQNNWKITTLTKIVKHGLLVFSFLLNISSLLELLDLEESKKDLET